MEKQQAGHHNSTHGDFTMIRLHFWVTAWKPGIQIILAGLEYLKPTELLSTDETSSSIQVSILWFPAVFFFLEIDFKMSNNITI